MNRIVGWGSADVLRTWSSLTRHSSLDEARLQQSKMERRKLWILLCKRADS